MKITTIQLVPQCMNLNKFYVLGCLLCCAFAKAYAQEVPTEIISKTEAVSQMLQNNFGIQLANNQVEIADNNTSILNSDYLPTVFGLAGANFDRTTSTTDFNGARDNDGNLRPDVVIPDAETVRYDASINASYTLFDGLGRYYNYKQLQTGPARAEMTGSGNKSSLYYTSLYYVRWCNKKSFYSQPYRLDLLSF